MYGTAADGERTVLTTRHAMAMGAGGWPVMMALHRLWNNTRAGEAREGGGDGGGDGGGGGGSSDSGTSVRRHDRAGSVTALIFMVEWRGRPRAARCMLGQVGGCGSDGGSWTWGIRRHIIHFMAAGRGTATGGRGGGVGEGETPREEKRKAGERERGGGDGEGGGGGGGRQRDSDRQQIDRRRGIHSVNVISQG